jgi:hypothetical protein
MTLRDVLSACCGMIFVLLAPAQAFGVECATEAQRKIEIETLNESVDWFLFIVEEVPEGIARQFKAVKPNDEAFRQAIRHPLWRAHKVREVGAGIKRELRPWTYDTPKDRLRAAIVALQQSASFSVALTDYLDHDRGRIIDAQNWSFRYTVLPADLAMYALCLVGDLAPR